MVWLAENGQTLLNLCICTEWLIQKDDVSVSFVPCQASFRKAMVLHEMGQVDESLQAFLHCLALDEDFPCAKRQVEKVRESSVKVS